MNKDLYRKRLKCLEDNISKDLDLLKSYEDELRCEGDPRHKEKYRLEIKRLRESMTRYQQEYEELKKQVTGEPPAEMVDTADLLRQMDAKLDESPKENEKLEEMFTFLEGLSYETVLLRKIESDELKNRAKKIRRFCKNKFAFLSQDLFRFYISHGVTHSEDILIFMDGILNAGPSMNNLNDYELFLLYVSAYCHDLGLLRFKGEDFKDSKKCKEVREKHCERIGDYLVDNWREMGILNETEATILGNICQVHRSKMDLGKLDNVCYAELGTMDPVPVRERLLGAILRLANALDADELRLPYEACSEDEIIPWKQYAEYRKHELVNSVKINPQKGIIHVLLRIKYEDPIDEKTREPIDIKKEVRSSLEKEFNSVKEVLADHKIELYGFNFVYAKAVSSNRKKRPAFANREEDIKRDGSPRSLFFENRDLPPSTDMIEYKKEKNKKVLLKELKLMTIDGDLTDEEIHTLLQEAKNEGIPDEETIRLIVEFANKNSITIVGIKEEKLPGIRKDLLALRKDYKT